MPFINWNSRYSVGVNSIDAQHNKLIDYINELHEAMKSGKAKDIIGNIIQNLIRYTSTHFALEEKHMSETKYPGLTEHKKEHQEFVQKVLEFQKSFNNGSSSVSIEILNFLRDWLLNHIAVTDKKYSPFFNEKGIK